MNNQEITEYDIISRGMELEGGYGSEEQEDPLRNDEGSALEGYEQVFDTRVALRPVELVPVV